jgi:hypothetical protein
MITLQAPLRAQEPTIADESVIGAADPDTGDEVAWFEWHWRSLSTEGDVDEGTWTMHGSATGPYVPCDCLTVASSVQSATWGFTGQPDLSMGDVWEVYIYYGVTEPVYHVLDCDSCPDCNISGATPERVTQTWNYWFVSEYHYVPTY